MSLCNINMIPISITTAIPNQPKAIFAGMITAA